MNPTLQVEHQLQDRGYRLIAGVDEAGRGCWAGPVVAGAVILPLDQAELVELLDGVRDSKLLTAEQRARCDMAIRAVAVSVGIGIVGSEEIDRYGIVPATRAAMRQAVAALSPGPDALILDAMLLPESALAQTSLVKADQLSLSVAAASIIAKVARDRLMADLDLVYPGYAFARHKGYGTPQHRAALTHLGPSPIHRWTFAPIRELLSKPQAV